MFTGTGEDLQVMIQEANRVNLVPRKNDMHEQGQRNVKKAFSKLIYIIKVMEY